MSAIAGNLDDERFQEAVRETYPDRTHLQQILSTVRLQLENGHHIFSDVVLQLLDRDPHTGTYTCSWHENATLCRWQGSQRASRAEAHINNHLERRPYICDGTQCGSDNWLADFCSQVTALTSWSSYSGSIVVPRFIPARTSMRTKPAGATCHVPGGMYLASGTARLTYRADSGKRITAQNMNRHQSSSACSD